MTWKKVPLLQDTWFHLSENGHVMHTHLQCPQFLVPTGIMQCTTCTTILKGSARSLLSSALSYLTTLNPSHEHPSFSNAILFWQLQYHTLPSCCYFFIFPGSPFLDLLMTIKYISESFSGLSSFIT